MKWKPNNDHTKYPKRGIYLSLFIIGILIMLLSSFIQTEPAPAKGEYYYSTFLRLNYTLLPKALFVIAGLLSGYFYRLNPWYAGSCLFLFFPLTSIIEGSVYRGSHNLIPFEFAMHFWYALPTIFAVYIGKFLFSQVTNRKRRIEQKV